METEGQVSINQGGDSDEIWKMYKETILQATEQKMYRESFLEQAKYLGRVLPSYIDSREREKKPGYLI
jgi:hypothetical protein